MNRRFAFALACVALSGCLDSDDLAFDAPKGPCTPHAPILHFEPDVGRPLAVGTTLHVDAYRASITPGVGEAITVTSTDPSVLDVSPPHLDSFTITATRTGRADLVFSFAGGSPSVSRSFLVADVTSFTAYSSLALLSGAAESEAQVDEPTLMIGGTTQLLVVPTNGSDPMAFDHVFLGVSDATKGESVSRVDFRQFFEVEVSAPRPGAQLVHADYVSSLFYPDAPYELDVRVRGVDPSSIATLALVTVGDTEAPDGRCITVVATPRDALGTLVHGGRVGFLEVEPNDWLGHGDAVAYVLRHASHTRLRANVGSVYAEVPIHAGDVAYARVAGESGGCSVVHGSPRSPLLVLCTLFSLSVRVLKRRRPNKPDSTS